MENLTQSQSRRMDSVGLACAALEAGGWSWDDLSEAQKDAWEFGVIRLLRMATTEITIGKILLEGVSDAELWHNMTQDERNRWTRAASAVFQKVGQDKCRA